MGWFSSSVRLGLGAIATFALAACGDGGGGDVSTPAPNPGPPPDPAPAATTAEAGRFLTQSTFGPTTAEIEEVTQIGFSEWFEAELAKPATLHLDGVLALGQNGRFIDDNGDPLSQTLPFAATNSFWRAAIEGDDQLRQRMAFALSQILVVSNQDFELFVSPQTLAAYMDILTRNAFGNYRDLLEEVTYSVAMADYLTYLRNAKGDMATGRVPDENYAREIMQLFTIGLVELNSDGTPRTDGGGDEIETYDNMDVTGLARVFTGLSLQGGNFFAFRTGIPVEAFYSPVEIYDFFHSDLEKSFLGVTIPAGTGAAESIDIALDTLVDHQNTPPFLARQLIQRFVTSDPDPNYVFRVASAFESGTYTLPNGTVVGDGRRGDLAATLAAILMDTEARGAEPQSDPEFGKVREPILRFTHWARAFPVNSADASNELLLADTSGPSTLAQAPYRAPSVFNFYRPGYVAPGTNTGAAGLTAPELQIVTASSITGYANFMTWFIINESPNFDDMGLDAFVPNYTAEIALADTPGALLDHLDDLLTYGTMEATTRTRIIETLDLIPVNDATRTEDLTNRVHIAVLMVMTSPEYLVLR